MNSEYLHGSQHFLDYLEQVHSLKVSLNPIERHYYSLPETIHKLVVYLRSISLIKSRIFGLFVF